MKSSDVLTCLSGLPFSNLQSTQQSSSPSVWKDVCVCSYSNELMTTFFFFFLTFQIYLSLQLIFSVTWIYLGTPNLSSAPYISFPKALSQVQSLRASLYKTKEFYFSWGTKLHSFQTGAFLQKYNKTDHQSPPTLIPNE